jgi:hypothetical protein
MNLAYSAQGAYVTILYTSASCVVNGAGLNQEEAAQIYISGTEWPDGFELLHQAELTAGWPRLRDPSPASSLPEWAVCAASPLLC